MKVLFTPPKFQFLGDFTPEVQGHICSDPQKALPCAERRVLSPHWSRLNAQCDLWPWQRNQKKERNKDSGKLAICPDHLRRRTEVKVCMPGGLRCVVYISSFIKIGPVVLPLWVVENRPSPLLWPVVYTTACSTVQTVITCSQCILQLTNRETSTNYKLTWPDCSMLSGYRLVNGASGERTFNS